MLDILSSPDGRAKSRLAVSLTHLALIDVMFAGCEQLVDGLRIGEYHEGKTARNTSVGIDLHRDALDLAELAEVIPELLIGGVAG